MPCNESKAYPHRKPEGSASKSENQNLKNDDDDDDDWKEAGRENTFKDVDLVIDLPRVDEVEYLHHHEHVEVVRVVS